MTYRKGHAAYMSKWRTRPNARAWREEYDHRPGVVRRRRQQQARRRARPEAKALQRVLARRWAKANVGKVRASRRAWELANPEVVRAKTRNHHRRHRPELREYERRDPRRLARIKRRKALLRSAVSAPGADLIIPDVVYERSGGACGICHGPLARVDMDIDHIIPLTRGGAHTYDNVQAAHRSCNRSKGNRLPEDVP
jgi:5-methylcytosine-specific restriction endonuclease McrA